MSNGEEIEEIALEDLQREFYQALTWYFSQRPTGFYSQLGFIKEQLEALNRNLVESSQASSKLTTALNRLTLWGVVIAGLGVLVGAGHLALELLKYLGK
jgi:hypothetical protein